jgi:hypothetical protein
MDTRMIFACKSHQQRSHIHAIRSNSPRRWSSNLRFASRRLECLSRQRGRQLLIRDAVLRNISFTPSHLTLVLFLWRIGGCCSEDMRISFLFGWELIELELFLRVVISWAFVGTRGLVFGGISGDNLHRDWVKSLPLPNPLKSTRWGRVLGSKVGLN